MNTVQVEKVWEENKDKIRAFCKGFLEDEDAALVMSVRVRYLLDEKIKAFPHLFENENDIKSFLYSKAKIKCLKRLSYLKFMGYGTKN